MKFTPRILLGISLLGAFVVAPLAIPVAQADPPSHAPAYGRRAKDDGTKYKKDKKHKKGKKDERDDRYDGDDRYDRDDRNATYNGVVTGVGRDRFELRVNGRKYDVYASSLPRDLSQGDIVRVQGRRSGDNDIRAVSVRITENRGDRYDDNRDNDGNNGNYDTLRGQVVNVRNSREFDIRIGGKTYNVYASSSTKNLSVGDEVRVYGRHYGDNDIRNASVSIIRNR